MVDGGPCGQRTAPRPAGPRPVETGGEPGGLREIDSRALFDGARTVAIRHGAETYTLRITRADKLILTK